MATTSRQIVYVDTDGTQTVEYVDANLFGNGPVASRPGTGTASGDIYVVLDETKKQFSWSIWDATASAWQSIEDRKSKLDATADPTTGDDSGDGYEVGSLWVNVTADTVFICTDATSTAAVWKQVSNTTGGGTGDVVGPASATDNAIARYDGTTGKLLQNSSITIDDSGNMVVGGNSVTLGNGASGAKTVAFAAAGTGSLSWDPTTARTLTLPDVTADLVAVGGQIGGTGASPDVRGLRETSGPTNLTLGAVSDGQVLVRSGSTIIGTTVSASGAPRSLALLRW